MVFNFNTKGWLAILIFLTALPVTVKADEITTVDIPMTTIALKAEAMETVWVTVVAPAPIATPTVPMHPSYTDAAIFKKDMLNVTNEYRKNHDAKPLKWNDTLAEISKGWADKCIWKHSKIGYGENLAYGFGNLSAAVIAWGEEGELYNYTLPTGFAEATGHFTQLVWKNSKQVGCAAVNCGYTTPKAKLREKRDISLWNPTSNAPGMFDLAKRDDSEDARAQAWYVVCEYYPPGNAIGDDNKSFIKNVVPGKKNSAASTTTTSATTTALTAEPSKNAATSTTTTTGSQALHTGGALRAGIDSPMGVLLVSLGTVCVGMGLYA